MKMSWMENVVPVSTWVAKNSFPTILSSLPDFSHFLNPENCSSIFNPKHHVRQSKEKKINWHEVGSERSLKVATTDDKASSIQSIFIMIMIKRRQVGPMV